MSTFDEMKAKPASTLKGGLRLSWEKEEAKFAKTMPYFLSLLYKYRAEEKEILYVFKPDLPVEKQQQEKNLVGKEGKNQNTVESNSVRGLSQIGSPTIQPDSEVQMNTPASDPLDDILGISEKPDTSKPKEDSDPFDLDSTSSCSPIPATPHIDKLDEEVRTQMGAVAAELKASRKPDLPAIPKMRVDNKEGELDQEKFAKVIDTANRMLEKLPDIDLDTIIKVLPEYAVTWEVDHLRERPNILTDKLLEIQAKRDSLFASSYHVIPVFHAMKKAADYIVDAGVDCSSASNKEKRQAQILMATSDFWVRYAKVVSTKEAIDYSHQHLEGQYECISRLISLLQLQNKIGDINRGALPFEPDPEPPKPEQSQAPVPVNPSKHKELETFDPTKKVVQAEHSGTQEVEF